MSLRRLRGKLVGYPRLLNIFPWSLNNFWNFPQCANHHCTGHATMSTECANEPLVTVNYRRCTHVFLLLCQTKMQLLLFVLCTMDPQCEDDCCRLCGFFFGKKRKGNMVQLGEFVKMLICLRQWSEWNFWTLISRSFPRSVDKGTQANHNGNGNVTKQKI